MSARGQIRAPEDYPQHQVPDLWTDLAACAGRWHLFWPKNGHPPEHGAARATREAKARELCRFCPVLADCTSWVLAGDEDPVPYDSICAGMDGPERLARRQAREGTMAPRLFL